MVTLAPPSSVLNPTLGAASASIEAHAAADILGTRPTEAVDPLPALVTVIFPGASPVPDVNVKTTASPARVKELVARTANHAGTAAATARRVVCIPRRLPREPRGRSHAALRPTDGLHRSASAKATPARCDPSRRVNLRWS